MATVFPLVGSFARCKQICAVTAIRLPQCSTNKCSNQFGQWQQTTCWHVPLQNVRLAPKNVLREPSINKNNARLYHTKNHVGPGSTWWGCTNVARKEVLEFQQAAIAFSSTQNMREGKTVQLEAGHVHLFLVTRSCGAHAVKHASVAQIRCVLSKWWKASSLPVNPSAFESRDANRYPINSRSSSADSGVECLQRSSSRASET